MGALTGFTWDKGTVYLWVEPRVAKNWEVRTAARIWNNARVTGQPWFALTSDRSAADVDVVTKALRPDGLVGGWALITETEGHTSTKGRVVLSWKTPAWARPVLATHELGHILGLNHRTGNTIMRTLAVDMAERPTSNDRTWLSRAY